MSGKVYLDDHGEPVTAAKVYLNDSGEPIQEKQAAAQPAKKGYLESGGMFGEGHIFNAIGQLAKAAYEHPVTAGAMAGSALATGGASIPAAMAASALGAAGGAGVGSIVDQVKNGPRSASDVAKTMASEGAAGAAGEGVGQVAGLALKALGNGMYRLAALPINKFTKYGDLIQEGIKNAVPVSKGGVRKAEGILAERAAEKAAAIADADARVALRTGSVAADAGANLQGQAARIKRAGLPDPGVGFDKRLTAFEANNPAYMAPSEMEAVKSTLDNTVGGAYRKLRMREPLTPSEHYGVEMTQAQSRALEDVVPGYRDLNKAKMNAEGLRQMIARRVAPTGSGGNQGLESAMMIAGGPAAILKRIVVQPPVMSRLGILADRAGNVTAPSLKAALIAALSGGE